MKREKGIRKEKGKEASRNDENIANLSLSDSDINHKRKVILKEAQKTLEVRQILGLVCKAMRRMCLKK